VSQAPPQSSPALETYFGLLRRLAEAGFETVVIGGCAVGAYARLTGVTVVSRDLDLLATRATLEGILSDAATLGLSVEKWPQPRTVPVAVLRWAGLEINILTASDGLSSADVEVQVAREFRLAESDPFSVLVVDPFDLLRNKLAIRRPKDEAHIEILKGFLEGELLDEFASAKTARERLGPIVRYLDVIGSSTLPLGLSENLIPIARDLADFRMLAHRIPLELSHALQNIDASEECRQAVQLVLGTRTQRG
jgi:hypothetical protein